MTNRVLTFSYVLVSMAAGTLASAQVPPAKTKTKASPAVKVAIPLRTPDGQPDLQGIWDFSTLTPLERPSQLGDKAVFTEKEAAEYEKQALQNNNKDRRDGPAQTDLSRAYNDSWYEYGKISKDRRTSLIIDPPDGKIPAWTPEAQKREDARPNWYNSYNHRDSAGPDRADSWEDRNLSERCMSRGTPRLPSSYNNVFQIVQTPQYIALLAEMVHEVRIIPLDNRPHVDHKIQEWLGDSRGHWENNTLVVDTTNFNDKVIRNIFNCCRGASTNLHVIERFTRSDANTIDYEYTVDDPTTFVRKWTVSLPMRKIKGPVFEYACHEGNFDTMTGILKGARAAEKKAAEANPGK
jgi:hypothetical protein